MLLLFPLITAKLPLLRNFTSSRPIMNQINHSPSITTEDHAWEIKGAAGLFSWDTIFSLRTPVSVKAGEQVKYSCF